MLFDAKNITIETDATAKELENAVNNIKEDNNLKGLSDYFITAQNNYEINALILLSIACLESGYGLSELAIKKNNLFGIDARDSLKNDFNAYGKFFNNKEECINHAGHRLGCQYLKLDKNASYRYCNGKKDIWSIGMKWCSKKDWGDKIVNIAERIATIIENDRKAISEQENNKSNKYKELYLDLKEKMDRIQQILNEVE